MNPEALYAALPDLSARIIQSAVVNTLNANWDSFCRHNQIKSLKLDDDPREVLAKEELIIQQGFVQLTTGQTDLWFDIGQRYRSIKYGALGLAMMTAGTLGDALQIACKYQALTFSLIHYRFQTIENGAAVLVADHEGIAPDLYEFTQHRDLGAVNTLIRDLMGNEQVLERVMIAVDAPRNWSELRRSFNCPVEFNADRTRWVFLPNAVGKALPLGDVELQTLYLTRCDQTIGKARSDAPLSHRLSMLLGSCPDAGALQAGDAARRLALSERTLHRRLADEGTRFSAIVDKARYDRACQLLSDPRMTVESIAFTIGFAEPSSFSRAFKRWSGMGALEYRRNLLGLGSRTN
ncbi:AraC family transcriptional regulator [Novosphingobium taihuense]|uniref:AraC-like DNA-binding protein n=2 Tax=Novosphingobium taihuense TaxID=260085 RepID=A0A7W7EXU2_9SPHN|nr:AraC family transcriptional regulator [Novosphingobium taihuense]MBB4615680.1 AraC-like DNA-binding protein [Novosphingobium taihuense]TWH78770.1 AraC-like DNA-binding protein [Novosphingobium taihuense]